MAAIQYNTYPLVGRGLAVGVVLLLILRWNKLPEAALRAKTRARIPSRNSRVSNKNLLCNKNDNVVGNKFHTSAGTIGFYVTCSVKLVMINKYQTRSRIKQESRVINITL